MSIQANKLRKMAAELIAMADAMQQTATTEVIAGHSYNRAAGLVCTASNKSTQLTRSQAIILNALLDNRGVCVTRQELMALVFGESAANVVSRTIDTHVYMLRKLLGENSIKTVNGRGYRL